MNLSYILAPSWPPLAWLARCEPSTNTIIVTHGQNVEITEDWFCEAAWDGKFEDGGFDRTDIVAGSGGRKRNGEFLFVSAGNTVDRLVSIRLKETVLVSNSLVCLAAAADLDFLIDHNWFAAFHSIVRGIEQYQAEIPSSHGNILLTYFHNLIWNGRILGRVEKPTIHRDFSSFERYYDFLNGTLRRVQLNAGDSARQHTFRPLTTISTGYDSSAVTALAKVVDPKVEGFTFGNTVTPSKDDGGEIARHLAVTLDLIDTNEWQNHVLPEVPHIAADCLGEDIQYTGADSILDARILLTGFHGDYIWGMGAAGASKEIVRGDPSGLSLTEYRLWANFLHCPIPFWGARQSTDVIRLSNQKAMSEWDIGGDYSRPICRRIVEGSGVPRELFGRKKTAATIWPYNRDQFLTPKSMENYLQWLQCNRSRLIHSPLAPIIANRTADRMLFKILKSAQYTAGKMISYGHSIKALDQLRKPLFSFYTMDWGSNSKSPWVLPLRHYIFPWAVEVAKRRYISED